MERQSKRLDTSSLDELLRNNHQAKDYFMSLGEAGMGKLRQCGNQIHSYDDLVSRAQETPY